MTFLNIYKNKKVLVTGHTGFKGSWLSLWLTKLDADVYGISKDIPTKPSNYKVSNLFKYMSDYREDITNYDSIEKIISEIKPDFVFHLAAQSLVRSAYDEPINTIKTNALGTVNIMEALRKLNKNVSLIMITSDKVYDNLEWVWGYRENDNLGGKDPYSASKGMAELAIKSYINSYFSNNNSNIKIGIARAGNVIGGGDWAANRIIADCVKSWSENKKVEIRNPKSTRPWQHVLEPLSGYLTLGHNLFNGVFNGEAFNFGPTADQNFTVAELINEMKRYWPGADWKDTSSKDNFDEAGLLKLNCDKSLQKLKWSPVLSFEENVKFTSHWYKYFYENKNENIYEFSLNQIDEYSFIAKKKESVWTK
tara:strand:- start:17998 stop:19092 length:1095 start_codon:yes stop_codon:yes gene_type:complete